MENFSTIKLHSKLSENIVPKLRWDGILDLDDHKEKCETKLKELLGWDDFKELRIVDNFYQTSAFYPMPTI